ncbi:MAG: HigA family addiction module antitoxin [Acidobacteriaceae bacterium]|jgi:addiction module HigA family antidote
MSIRRPAGGWQFQRVTTHPGEMLVEEFLKPLRISQNQLALDLRVPANRIGQIVRGLRGVTPETALRLARYFGNSPEFWLNLQQMYDLSHARKESGRAIEEEVRPMRRSA